MKKKIVFGFAGLMLALFVGNFIGNDVKEVNAQSAPSDGTKVTGNPPGIKNCVFKDCRCKKGDYDEELAE